METKNINQARKLVSRLCCQGETVIESEEFTGVNYLIKNNHIAILAGRNGELAVSMDSLPDLIKELSEIHSLWSDID